MASAVGSQRSSTCSCGQRPTHRGEQPLGGGAVDEEALGGVADAGALHLAVHRDGHGVGLAGRLVEEEVADPLVVLDHRDPGALGHGPDEPGSAARDGQVDEVVEGEQLEGGLPVGHRNHLGGLGRETGRLEPVGEGGAERQRRGQRVGAGAQDAGVAALHAECSGLGGDVGPGLVDHEHHAQRDAHLLHRESVGTAPGRGDAPHRIGECGHLAEGRGDGVEPPRVEAEPVEEGLGGPGPAGGGQVGAVGLQDGGGVRGEGRGGCAERLVLLLGGGAGQDPGGPPRPGGQVAHAQGEAGVRPAHRVASGSVRTMSFRWTTSSRYL